jgi:polyhydroxybutyrate depolymerase
MLSVLNANDFVRLTLLALVLLTASCGGGGGGEVPVPPPEPAPESGETPASPSAVLSVTLPAYPHQIDVYAATGATRAIVFLHGGGGRNYRSAYELGVNLIDAPPTTASANWTWLEANKVLALFPQGQALPEGSRTWNNHVMDSGEDDVGFLQALAVYVQLEHGISDVYLAGHSNGGMMANRIWCESPASYQAYIALAGPASDYYSTTTPCAPSVPRPYLGIVGELDNVLQVEGNWEALTWAINPILVALTPVSFVNPVLIGEWVQHQARAQAMCGENPVLADKASDGVVESWRNCSGRVQLHRSLSGSHSFDSLEAETGYRMIDIVAEFIGGI